MKHQSFVITGGRLIDPASGIDAMSDLWVSEGRVKAVDKPGAFSTVSDVEFVDARGCLVVPGLVDIHTHLREPGFEWKETIATGCSAAIAGGFTSVCCMPNTDPINDTASVTQFILKKAREANLCNLYPIGAITTGIQSKGLSPMIELREAGCVAFSDDGQPVSDAGIMRRALEYSLMLDTVLTCHEEEKSLCHGFSMNESAVSLKLGLKGMPGAAEDIMISRDIELARLTKAPVHFCHVSTLRGVTLIRRAKEDGIPVTAEVAPHHFTLDDSSVGNYDTQAKMSPPLRGREDVEGVLAGFRDGVIDCIASDHAPHENDSKNREFEDASFGILGFQTTLPLTLAKVREGKVSLDRAIEGLTIAPSRCLKLPSGSLKPGSFADITIIDEKRSIVLSPDILRSKSKNSPFLNQRLTGVAVKTFVAGREVFDISSLRNCSDEAFQGETFLKERKVSP